MKVLNCFCTVQRTFDDFLNVQFELEVFVFFDFFMKMLKLFGLLFSFIVWSLSVYHVL